MTTSENYDVVVVGGGAAGVAAAVGAAREGAKTLLLERYGFLGGAATNSGVLAYCGFWTQGDHPFMGVRGVGAEVLDELATLGADIAPRHTHSDNWVVALDAENVKLALDRVVARHHVDCLLHSRVTGARRVDGRLEAIVASDHAGTREIAAASFIDASGQADLVAAAGGAVVVPSDEARQPASLPVRFGAVPPSIEIDRAAVRTAIAGLNDVEEGIRVRPEGGIFFRLPISNDIWWLGMDMLTDGLSGASLSRAEIGGRATAWRVLSAFKQHVPGFAEAYISGTGPQIGIREARTATPREAISPVDMLAGRHRADGVACGCWPSEVHHGLSGATYDRIGGDGYYHIPHDALRSADLDNVWLAGRVIGCVPAVYGSLRVMGTAFATGHAAGVAAACAAQGTGDIETIRAALLRQGAFI
jgi:hypothetical protein